MLALLLVLAASPDGGAAAKLLSTDKLLESCKRSIVPGGLKWDCDGLTVAVTEGGDFPVANVASAFVGHLRELPNVDVSTWDTDIALAGQKFKGYRVEVRGLPRGEVQSNGRLVMNKTPKGIARIAYCGEAPVSANAGRCDELLKKLIDSGQPKNIRWRPEELPMFAGKAVTIPEGCALSKVNPMLFQIDCGRTASLTVFALDPREDIPLRVTGQHHQLLNMVEVSAAGPDKPCKVGGVASTCKTLIIGDLNFFLGGAVVEGASTLVQCAQPKGTAGFHPLCARVLSN